MAIDMAEDRAVRGSLGQPGLQCTHRAARRIRIVGDPDPLVLALLVGLGAPQRDLDALRNEAQVGPVERDQLGAAQRPGPAEQQQRALAREASLERAQRVGGLGGRRDVRVNTAASPSRSRCAPTSSAATTAARMSRTTASFGREATERSRRSPATVSLTVAWRVGSA